MAKEELHEHDNPSPVGLSILVESYQDFALQMTPCLNAIHVVEF